MLWLVERAILVQKSVCITSTQHVIHSQSLYNLCASQVLNMSYVHNPYTICIIHFIASPPFAHDNHLCSLLYREV